MIMPKIEFYATRSCPCHSAKALLPRKDIAYTEIDVTGDPPARGKMVERAPGAIPYRRIFSARPMSVDQTISLRSTTPASSTRCSRPKTSR